MEIKRFNQDQLFHAKTTKESELAERAEGFVNPVDHAFVKHYAIEQMQDLLKLERANRLDYLFDVSKHCSEEVCAEFDFKYGDKRQRAHLVDSLFAAGALPALNMSDKSLIYQAVSIFDKFWNNEAIGYMHFKITGAIGPDK